MTQNEKPREFWIGKDQNDHYRWLVPKNPDVQEMPYSFLSIDANYKCIECIIAIEHSAYLAIQQELEEYKWFAAQINKYVLPGEFDTEDAARVAFLKLEQELENLNKNCISLYLHEARIAEMQRENFIAYCKLDEINTRLNDQLEEAREVIEWYGNKENWFNKNIGSSLPNCRNLFNPNDCQGEDFIGGYEAREYLAKYPRGEK